MFFFHQFYCILSGFYGFQQNWYRFHGFYSNLTRSYCIILVWTYCYCVFIGHSTGFAWFLLVSTGLNRFDFVCFLSFPFLPAGSDWMEASDGIDGPSKKETKKKKWKNKTKRERDHETRSEPARRWPKMAVDTTSDTIKNKNKKYKKTSKTANGIKSQPQ